jgi:hypothetical protein
MKILKFRSWMMRAEASARRELFHTRCPGALEAAAPRAAAPPIHIPCCWDARLVGRQ